MSDEQRYAIEYLKALGFEVIPRAQLEALMRLQVAARCLTARASGVTVTDVAGNSFRSVFADDLTALDAALRAAGIDLEDKT